MDVHANNTRFVLRAAFLGERKYYIIRIPVRVSQESHGNHLSTFIFIIIILSILDIQAEISTESIL